MKGALLVGGIVIGWLVWGASLSPKDTTEPMGTHMMADGTMMHGDGGDMASMMADMNAALSGKKGDAFDQAFLSEMIVHHEGAVAMAELALTSAKHQELKDLATAIIAAQTTEIEQMKQWQRTWYQE